MSNQRHSSTSKFQVDKNLDKIDEKVEKFKTSVFRAPITRKLSTLEKQQLLEKRERLDL